MIVSYRASYLRDVKKIKDASILKMALKAVQQVKDAAGVREIAHIKKFKGQSGYYRIRIGDFRIGVLVEDDKVEFLHCLHRNEIYRHFP